MKTMVQIIMKNYYHNTETQLGAFFDLLSHQAATSNNKEPQTQRKEEW